MVRRPGAAGGGPGGLGESPAARPGPGAAPGPPPAGRDSGSLARSQSVFFHRGNHGLRGPGPGYIHVILSNAAAGDRSAPGPAAARAPRAGPGALHGLAGGEARVVDPAEMDYESSFDSPEGEGSGWGNDPEYQTDEEPEDDPGVPAIKCNNFIVQLRTIYVQYCDI
jgi:hypothetical protein